MVSLSPATFLGGGGGIAFNVGTDASSGVLALCNSLLPFGRSGGGGGGSGGVSVEKPDRVDESAATRRVPCRWDDNKAAKRQIEKDKFLLSGSECLRFRTATCSFARHSA